VAKPQGISPLAWCFASPEFFYQLKTCGFQTFSPQGHPAARPQVIGKLNYIFYGPARPFPDNYCPDGKLYILWTGAALPG